MNQDNVSKECTTCQGYGMWAFGLPTSMGERDATTFRTLPCPECGANANPDDVVEDSND